MRGRKEQLEVINKKRIIPDCFCRERKSLAQRSQKVKKVMLVRKKTPEEMKREKLKEVKHRDRTEREFKIEWVSVSACVCVYLYVCFYEGEGEREIIGVKGRRVSIKKVFNP